MIRGIHHIAIHVHDLDAMLAFYDACGFRCVHRDTTSAWISTPTVYLHVHHQPRPQSPHPRLTDAGISHICLQHPNMQRAVDIIDQHGFIRLSDPINLGTGHWYLYAKTASGDIIEIEGVPYAPADTPPWIAHVALVSPYIQRLVRFYQHLSHTTATGGHAIGPNPRFDQVLDMHHARMIPTWLTNLNLTLEFWQFLHPATRTRAQPPFGYRHIAFEVTDYAQSMTTAVASGASRMQNHQATPLWHDPDGNGFLMLDTHALTQLPNAVQHWCHTNTQVANIRALWQPMDANLLWSKP